MAGPASAAAAAELGPAGSGWAGLELTMRCAVAMAETATDRDGGGPMIHSPIHSFALPETARPQRPAAHQAFPPKGASGGDATETRQGLLLPPLTPSRAVLKRSCTATHSSSHLHIDDFSLEADGVGESGAARRSRGLAALQQRGKRRGVILIWVVPSVCACVREVVPR